MLIAPLTELFLRDLGRLRAEVEAYQNEAHLWKTEGQITNSGGNLCLHLIGNLKTYLGAGLGNQPYQRQRELEFSAKNVARKRLLAEIDETITAVVAALEGLTEEELSGNFPVVIWSEPTPMIFTLLHLHGHLNYHLGQINYHRRLLDGNT